MDTPGQLRPIVQEISNTAALRDAVEKTKENMKDTVLKYFFELGKSLGFISLENAPLLRYSTNIGNIDCVWRDNDHIAVGLNIVFGSKEETLAAIFKLAELSPALGVIVISSKSTSGFTVNSLSSLLKLSPLLHDLHPFMIIDVSTGATELIQHIHNEPFQEQRRRKPIVGFRPKTQD